MRSSGVRPAIRRGAIVALILLLPFAAHSIWDYVEIRRLVREIEAIQAKGEPVRPSDVVDQYEPRGDGFGPFAGSHYLAAAILISPDHATVLNDALSRVRSWIDVGDIASVDWRPVVERAQEVVLRHGAALALVDRAASLEFKGFPIDTELRTDYSYRTADLSRLSRLLGARTIGLTLAGDGDRAVESALSAIQLRRAVSQRVFLQGHHQTAVILSLSTPSLDALQRLDAALAAEDRPAERTRWFLQQRANYVDTFWRRYYGTDPAAPSVHLLRSRSVSETAFRPWFTHQFVEMLQVWDELGDALRAPAPRNAQLGAEVERRHPVSGPSNVPDLLRRSFPFLTEGLVNPPLVLFKEALRMDDLTIDRASRVAVAIERYRRDHAGEVPGALTGLVPRYLPSLPVDPVTGGALLYRRSEQDYTVYSVGADRTDDGGVLLRATPASRGSVASARRPDVGVRVLIRR